MECPACHKADVTGLVCDACPAVLPPRPIDKFAALGVGRVFALDKGELESRYRDLSRRVHPDRFAMAGARERMLSLQAATTLNDAYRALRSPVERAEYLLDLKGVKVSENDKGDPTFLMEVMELREELAEAKGNPDRLTELGASMQTRYDQTLDQVGDGFAAHAQGGQTKDLEQVRDSLVSLRFFRRYLDEVEAGLETL